MSDLALVQACEERIVNAWPGVETLLIEGWIVRFANGYSGRANSLSAPRPGLVLTGPLLDLVEGLYAQAGLPGCARVTPLCDDGVMPLLTARGYRMRDRSIGMVAPLAAQGWGETRGAFTFSASPDAAWIRAVSARQEGNKKDADAALAAIVGRIRMPAAFATLHHEGEPVAFGMSVAERGMAEIGAIVVDEAVRGRGFGRALVAGLMGWAGAQGAAMAYLQVEYRNTAALRTYQGLGFTELYRYDTMVRPL